jgi:hypothetical protein
MDFGRKESNLPSHHQETMKKLSTTAAMIAALLTPLIADPATPGTVVTGDSLEGWFVNPANPPVWRIVKDKKGVVSIARQPAGSYLWTKTSFGDFELNLEYKVSKGCNSGLFFRTDPNNPVQGGFEIQIFDSHGQDPNKHNTGALYDARPASAMPEKPAGQWNTLSLKVVGTKLVCVINGTEVQDLDLADWDTPNKNPDGSKNKFRTALKDLPRAGHIGFQDHGHNVWYRKISIKAL